MVGFLFLLGLRSLAVYKSYMTKNIGMVLVDLRHVYFLQMFCSDNMIDF